MVAQDKTVSHRATDREKQITATTCLGQEREGAVRPRGRLGLLPALQPVAIGVDPYDDLGADGVQLGDVSRSSLDRPPGPGLALLACGTGSFVKPLKGSSRQCNARRSWGSKVPRTCHGYRQYCVSASSLTPRPLAIGCWCLAVAD